MHSCLFRLICVKGKSDEADGELRSRWGEFQMQGKAESLSVYRRTSDIHLLVLFLNPIHLASAQTDVARWKGFMCMMDAIVKNAKVNTRRLHREGKKQRERTYLFPKRLPCISFCNLTLRPCNNIQREDNCWERFLRLASKFYHGLTAPLNGATMSQSIQYVKGIRF